MRRSKLKDCDKIAHVQDRCKSIERDVHTIRKSVKEDFIESLCEIRTIRRELQMALQFVNEHDSELKEFGFNLFSTYKQCDDSSAALQRMFQRIADSLIRRLSICEQNVEMVRQVCENGWVDADKFETDWRNESGIGEESPIVPPELRCSSSDVDGGD